MREVKFRAWDTSEKKMHTEISLLFANDLNGVFEGLIECGCIAMQFTGLHDKNGVEIYEGDIVVRNSNMYTIEYWSNQLLVGWHLKDISCGDTEYLDCFGILEVIGNIHSNPELLESEE